MSKNRWDEVDEQKPWRTPPTEQSLDLYIDPVANKEAANAVAYSVVKVPAKLHFTAPPPSTQGKAAFELRPAVRGDFRKQTLLAVGRREGAAQTLTLDLDRKDGRLQFVEELRQTLTVSAATSAPVSGAKMSSTSVVDEFVTGTRVKRDAEGRFVSKSGNLGTRAGPGKRQSSGRDARTAAKPKRTG